MKKYHLAWLEAHPERSREWLKKMLAEGFDVHHIDLDHGNNHPANLLLVDSVDHMRLHGMFALVRPNHREAVRQAAKARWSKKSKTERSYHARMMAAKRWGYKAPKPLAKAANARKQRLRLAVVPVEVADA